MATAHARARAPIAQIRILGVSGCGGAGGRLGRAIGGIDRRLERGVSSSGWANQSSSSLLGAGCLLSLPRDHSCQRLLPDRVCNASGSVFREVFPSWRRFFETVYPVSQLGSPVLTSCASVSAP